MPYVKTFKIDIEPRGKGRPRFSKCGHTYTDSKTRQFEKDLSQLASLAWKNNPLKGAVAIEIEAYFKRPKSVKRELHTVSPDADNVIKACLDALNKIVFEDDKQICSVSCKKFYAEKEGFILIKVFQIDDIRYLKVI